MSNNVRSVCNVNVSLSGSKNRVCVAGTILDYNCTNGSLIDLLISPIVIKDFFLSFFALYIAILPYRVHSHLYLLSCNALFCFTDDYCLEVYFI